MIPRLLHVHGVNNELTSVPLYGLERSIKAIQDAACNNSQRILEILSLITSNLHHEDFLSDF